jgi:hypothetical protein
MKKALSILILGLILLSGMNFTVASHTCGGELVATKMSFDEELASCGMENDQDSPSKELLIKADCCHDQINAFTVDKQYQPSTFILKKVFPQEISLFVLPQQTLLFSSNYTKKHTDQKHPPDNEAISDVSLSRICVFII